MIETAKTAGFCFGVGRATSLLENMISDGKSVCTLGPIIHNPVYIEELQKRGVTIAENTQDVPSGTTLVLRTHGVTKDISQSLKNSGIDYVDATCPFVAKIHKIVSEESRGAITFIMGDSTHPEVMGIRSYSEGPSYTFKDDAELQKVISSGEIDKNAEIICVEQTTFNIETARRFRSILENTYPNLRFFNTICLATSERQKEAMELSKRCDVMIIVGGKNSSNTQKLRDVCAANCPSFLVEKGEELYNLGLPDAKNIGITAGASTPDRLIRETEEVCRRIFKSK